MARQNKGRNRIAHELGIGQGTVSNILKEWRKTSSNSTPATIPTPQSESEGSVCKDACHQHEHDIHSNASGVEQDNSGINNQIDINKISPPSLKPQDVNGVGLAVPVNPNYNVSIQRSKPRNGGPLVSHLPVENFIEDKDNPNPSQTKTNINNNENGKYLHNQDETIKEEKQYQHRASLSDFENTSRRSYNRGKEDQDQEEEPIDLGIDWNRRFPRYESRSSLRYYKTRDSGSENSITSDIYENWQSEFWGRVLQEKDEQQRRLRLIQHHKGLLEKQRQRLLELKQSLDKQNNDIQAQKSELKEMESLIPQVRQLKNAGVDFTLLMQIVATLNEAAIFQNVNLSVAAANVAQEIRLCRELGGVKQAVEKARHQLSTMESLIQNQNNGLQPHVNVNNGHGLTADSYAKLAMAREAMVKMLDKVRGGYFSMGMRDLRIID